MVLTVSFVFFILFDTSLQGGQSKFYSRSLATGIILFDVLFTIAYITFPNPVLHQVAFAGMQLISTGRGIYLLYFSPKMQDTPEKVAQNRQSRNMQNTGECAF